MPHPLTPLAHVRNSHEEGRNCASLAPVSTDVTKLYLSCSVDPETQGIRSEAAAAALGCEAVSDLREGVHEAVAAGAARAHPHGREGLRLRGVPQGVQPEDHAADTHGQAQASFKDLSSKL